jgi:iron complex transport system substrate-binding protein
LEWFEPLYTAGHWVPEMVALAGGHDVLGRAGEPSMKIEWQNVIDAKPEVLLLMPCGFDVRRTVKESTPLRALPGWNDLPAVRSENVFALNGNAYFSRPGPRLVNGLKSWRELFIRKPSTGRSGRPTPRDSIEIARLQRSRMFTTKARRPRR